MAASAYFNTVQKLYIAYYQRPADPAGLLYWAQRLDAAGGSLVGIINAFATSAESQALYGTINANTIDTFIDSVYQALFNRAPDAAGKAFYKNGFLNGTFTAGNIALDILNGAQGDDAVAIQNKVTVASRFTEAVDGRAMSSSDFGTGTAFAATYSGNTDAEVARNWLKNVTSDPATVKTASQVAADVQANIADAGDPIKGATTGQTFTLTAGADNIVGTAGNDTINALTVNAQGGAATTLSAFDSIDGGAGTDILNIYSDGTDNTSLPTSATVKNVEIINIFNDTTAFHTGTANQVNAAKFAGATKIEQNGVAADVLNLAATTTASFNGIDLATEILVGAATGVTSVNVALNAVGDGNGLTQNWLQAGGDAVTTFNITGAQAAEEGAIGLDLFVGKDVQTAVVNSAVDAEVYVYDSTNSASGYGVSSATLGGYGGTKTIITLDASGSTGGIISDGISYGSSNTKLVTIKTGSGNDDVTLETVTVKDDATTAADETVTGVADTGTGNDKVSINTTGTGATTVTTGAGDDTVTLSGRGSGKLTVNLGAGNDTFTGTGSVAGTDLIDGGDGSDTLLLKMVGAANIGAFQNFEVFDAAGLAKTLDLDILATKNTVTEIVASADVGSSAVLTNLGAGVGYRVTGDTDVAKALTLTQKTAGALTVTLDIDETGTTAATTASTNRDAAVVASNATSVKAVFDSAFVGAATGSGDNATSLTITGTKATSLEVVSGGANASNTLLYTGGDDATTGKGDLLTTVTISGDRAVNFDYTADDATEITSINASALTGGLTFALDDLKAGGTLTLGSGDDVITAQTGVGTNVATIIGAMRKISGIEKGTAEDSTIQSNYDVIVLSGAVQAADDTTGTTNASVKDGKITFKGAGPATLADAVTYVQALIDANEAAVFEYVGKSYIFAEGATDGAGDDVLIELTGVTGLNGLDVVNNTAGTLYVF